MPLDFLAGHLKPNTIQAGNVSGLDRENYRFVDQAAFRRHAKVYRDSERDTGCEGISCERDELSIARRLRRSSDKELIELLAGPKLGSHPSRLPPTT
jgi:hypothetical protein